ncbi:MAG TPA: globin domain-containing protein [Methyloceanibacter sp.]|nr:globin domain-containing protein [Methyloceanibacter sp.]
MSAVLDPRPVRSIPRVEPAPFGAGEILLTPAQKRLIHQSFVKLEPALELVGQLFFLKLYRLDPALRERFGSDPKKLGRKFMAAAKLTVIALKYDDCLAPTLRLLGVRQRMLGMKVRDYRLMGKAWTWTLERSLEKQLTRQTKDAWTSLITQVSRLLSGSEAALLHSVTGSAEN